MSTLTVTAKQLNALRAVLESVLRQRQFIENFARDNRLLAGFFRDAIRSELAQRGWFVAGSLYSHQFPRLAKALKQQREREVEEFLKTHVRGILPDARSRAIQKWPKRAQILADAFECHDAAKYTLSVPIFLAQADGISADLLGALLFTNREGQISHAASGAIDSHFRHRPLAKSFLGLLLEASGL